MHYTGMVYRPPVEANTPLLEITYGCSWNKCSFCSMYQDTRFGVSPLEHIESDLRELRQVYSEKLDKIFVVNGDAFTLPADKLIEISDLIHKYFPNINRIACYTSIRNIKTKTLEELCQLHEHGYDSLYIGLETAYGPALKQMNKGYTQEDEYEQLKKIEKANISYIALLMFGVAGKYKSTENIDETVKLLNKYKPAMIIPTSTSIQEGTPLEKYRNQGDFVELTEADLINEELMLLENLEMGDDCYYFGSHPYNLINVSDYFRNKDKMIQHIKNRLEYIKKTRPEVLNAVLSRGSL